MNKYITKIILGLLIMSILAVPNAAALQTEAKIVSVENVVSDIAYSDMDFSKLQINPGYLNMQIKPGNSDEVTVTVTNKDNKTITIAPFVSVAPYSDNLFEENWITITPMSADIAPDAKQEFVIDVNIPQDADIGHYSTSIAFTEDVMPTPYPTPYPDYLNSLRFSVEVWTPPNIQIQTPYINSRVESGESYDFEIKLENVADYDISIDPKIDDNNRMYDYGPYGMTSCAFEDDAITITAPSVVKAGETAIVSVHLEVPDDSKGRYNGAIDLNINDPSIQQWDGQVQMNFEVWTQPTEPYTKTFTTKTDDTITIEISSNPFDEYAFAMWMGADTQDKKDPSFDVTLEGNSGTVDMTLVKTTYSGSVTLGMSSLPPWEMESTGIYQDLSSSYIEEYSAPGAAGNCTLGILPCNTDMFSYTITVGPGE